MICNLKNSFVKFCIDFDRDFDLKPLQEFLGRYAIIDETNNVFEDYDLFITFLNKEDKVFDNNSIQIDDHLFKRENKRLFVGISNYEYDEILFIKRVLIDLINRFFESKKGIFLHSSAIVSNDNSIIFIGDKGSGKTTNMLYMLNNYKFAYSSNERTGLKLDNDVIISYGNPSRINIRANTLKFNESLRNNIGRCIDINKYNFLSNCDLPRDCSERLVVSFNELSASLGIDIVPISKLKVLLNLIYTPNITFDFEEISYSKIRTDIMKSEINGVYNQRALLNDIFPVQIESIDNILGNSAVSFYNIYQDGSSDNSSKILKVLKKDLNNERS